MRNIVFSIFIAVLPTLFPIALYADPLDVVEVAGNPLLSDFGAEVLQITSLGTELRREKEVLGLWEVLYEQKVKYATSKGVKDIHEIKKDSEAMLQGYRQIIAKLKKALEVLTKEKVSLYYFEKKEQIGYISVKDDRVLKMVLVADYR